ncbi:bifunctional copper resistance protein CopD/cytochrome c oxidase assembly protein [Corynebacterium phocae]|nr:cytochrome c oxidase assembly protein [Corynebacterium phocae]KAA8726425.1 bifunctional copper resistance protein CopD/cytochrome c oxidase assembly protein [Corynebacterium phocae]
MSSTRLPAATPAPSTSSAARGSTGIFIGLGVLAGCVAAFISWFFLQDSLAALGIPDPGRLTTVGLPFIRAAAWMAVAACVGSFFVSAFLISPGAGGDELIGAPLTVDGHIAARAGAISALAVALLALVEIPLVFSDITGSPVSEVLSPELMAVAFNQIATAKAWAVTALMALAVGIGGLIARKWAAQPLLFLGALTLIVPLGMEGHSAAGGDHDYGTNSFLIHLIFMVIWVGGLLGLLAHARRLGPDLTRAVRRYSLVALVSVVAMSISGVLNASLRLEFSDWLTTRYGLIIVAKVVLTLVLALLGFAHRQLTIPQLERQPGLFRRVALVELAVMAATVGVAGTMGRTPPPPPRDPNLNAMQLLLGYELDVAPTAWNIWTMFRFDILWGTLGLVLAGLYGYALHRVRQRGLSWPLVRTAWWMAGSLGLVVVMSTGIGLYMPALYSMHMLGHMVLSMVIPLFLVLGAPLTLAMEAFAPADEPGIHEWAVAITKSRTVAFITHPVVNVTQFVFFFYAMYMSYSFYEYAISEHAGHVVMNCVFLASGYFYFWELVGPDPLPNRRPTAIRLFLLFISMPVHLYAGVYLMQLGPILGEGFYSALGLPWAPDLHVDQKVGGGIAWGFGQFPLVIVFGYLFVEWLREDRSTARRMDAKADLDGDQDLEDYNAMLAALNGEDDSRHFRGR